MLVNKKIQDRTQDKVRLTKKHEAQSLTFFQDFFLMEIRGKNNCKKRLRMRDFKAGNCFDCHINV